MIRLLTVLFSMFFLFSFFVTHQSISQTPNPIDDTIENFDDLLGETPDIGETPDTGTGFSAPVLEFSEDPLELDPEPVPFIDPRRQVITPEREQYRRYIEHPNAEKGLIKIDKDRVYHYKVPQTESKHTGSFRLGVYEPTNLGNPDSDLTYNDIYDEDPLPLLLYDHERTFFWSLGRLSYVLGAGLFLSSGNGRFADQGQVDRPNERFTLFAFPLSAGLSYRLQFADYQRVVPYGNAGVDLFLFGERRDDDNNPDWGAALGAAPLAHFAGGLQILMGKNANSFLDLNREYGINRMWFTAEYRNYISLSDKFDFSGDAISGGITFEY